MSSLLECFSDDYRTARDRFRKATASAGWSLESHLIDRKGPDGEDLTMDVAIGGDLQAASAVLVCSGLHGVEGHFGSAVQLAYLRRWAESSNRAPLRYVWLHALNPFGFAWGRRWDENNVDPNRNYLLLGEEFSGATREYSELNGLLNPRRPPSRLDLFSLRAALWIARCGVAPLRQAIAAGQYQYPQGLFYGGDGPSQSQMIVASRLADWLGDATRVAHLDFHTGLGKWATYKLLIDYPLTEEKRQRLRSWFGADSYQESVHTDIAYHSKGSMGHWCVAHEPERDYLYACAEFGTYGPLQVVRGLRSENQAYHWGRPDASREPWTRRLRELFCPTSRTWRIKVVEQGCDLIDRSVRGLTESQASP